MEPPMDLGKMRGVAMRVRGDGQRYKLLLRDTVEWFADAFEAECESPLTPTNPRIHKSR